MMNSAQNATSASRKSSDYNVVFARLAAAEPNVVEAISSIATESANIARYQQAADAIANVASLGFTSSLA